MGGDVLSSSSSHGHLSGVLKQPGAVKKTALQLACVVLNEGVSLFIYAQIMDVFLCCWITFTAGFIRVEFLIQISLFSDEDYGLMSASLLVFACLRATFSLTVFPCALKIILK